MGYGTIENESDKKILDCMDRLKDRFISSVLELVRIDSVEREACDGAPFGTGVKRALECALDISGRAHLEYGLTLPSEKIGTFDTELGREFFLAVSRELKLTLHLRQFSGLNSHHILEAAFKGFGRAMLEAVAVDPDARGGAASTKGVLL